MPNENSSDNIMAPRTVVAPATAVHWTGATPAVPDGSRYVRGTIELVSPSATGTPAVGVIESCELTELGDMEKLSNGACGTDAYDFYDLGWKADVTARFRKLDDPPRKGQIYVLNIPEGGQAENLPLRLVCTDDGASWSEKGIRKCKFSGEIAANLVHTTLVSAALAGNAGAEVLSSTSNSALDPGFGDDTGGGYAAQVLTSTGVNVSDNDTVTLGSTVYRFKATMLQAYDVQIGSSAANSLANLKMAINATGVAGTNYYAGTLVHPTVTAGAITSTTLTVTANAIGTGGNSIASTEVAATLSWGAGTLAGGY
jgi:hypothetical protein